MSGSIWQYQQLSTDRLVTSSYASELIDTRQDTDFPMHPTKCTFCGHEMKSLAEDREESRWIENDVPNASRRAEGWNKSLSCCNLCGWWSILAVEHCLYDTDTPHNFTTYRYACGVLRELDLTDIATPTDLIQDYLTARYSDRFHVHPSKFEDVVAQVFRDFGYTVRQTAYSSDDGIDAMILDGPDAELVGVQVKRYSASIEANQIRELAGSLVLHGITRGIFVTTSRFTKGSSATASRLNHQGVRIELVDSDAFYASLKLVRRPAYEIPDDVGAPFSRLWKDRLEIPKAHVHEAVYD